MVATSHPGGKGMWSGISECCLMWWVWCGGVWGVLSWDCCRLAGDECARECDGTSPGGGALIRCVESVLLSLLWLPDLDPVSGGFQNDSGSFLFLIGRLWFLGSGDKATLNRASSSESESPRTCITWVPFLGSISVQVLHRSPPPWDVTDTSLSNTKKQHKVSTDRETKFH